MNSGEDSLDDEIVAEAIRRYQQGDALVTVAADLGVSYRRLFKATASARATIRRRLSKLAPEILEEALARHKQGTALTAIARDMGINYGQFVEATTASRARIKRQPRRKPIPDHQLAQALQRYAQGEALKAIAHDIGVDYQQLVAETAATRRALPAPPPKGGLSDATKQAAIARWNAGETLKAIAADMGIPERRLTRATAAMRQGAERSPCKRQPLPPPEVIAAATTRWRSGETLAEIADSLGIDSNRLTHATAAARKGMKRGTRPVLPAELLEAALALWDNGETLPAIAARLHIRLDQLKKAMAPLRETGRRRQPVMSPALTATVMARWQQGETLTAIARDLGVPYAWLEHRTSENRRGKRRPRKKFALSSDPQ